MQFSCERENPVVWFQPILDTADSRVFAHQCLFGGNSAKYSATALRAVSARNSRGQVFIDVSGQQPEAVLAALGSRSSRIVCQFRVGDPAREAVFLERLQEIYVAGGCQFALEVGNASPEMVSLLEHLRPKFIKLHQSLARRIEDPSRASAVRHLVEVGELAGNPVIATGVRDQDTVENLWLLGVRKMQGDHFGPPASAMYTLQNAQSKLVNPVWAL